ncbi:PTS sugar transporter subunit IIA [Streptococcus pneumoniae]|uniref:PTS sugar transporter subunit IIA n=1 Tax=Streptococcus pneumoniae TaxID=1313 RepID=UPI0005E9F641|nr:PTS sugar transporter subunit IIA [Streptococcus pneumoniae]CJX86576.1 PTS system transporter subunit IIA [Streptococcus pneumoniae]
MVLDYFFDKNLVFCLEADNQEQLFDQVASLLEEREIVTPTYREALITREKSFPTGLDMEFLGKDLPNVAIPHTDIVHNLAERAIKSLVMGRKNWLFSQSFEGAKATAIIMSLLETAKRHQLNSEKYLSYLLECLPNEETLVNKEVLEAYLPWNKVVQEKCK